MCLAGVAVHIPPPSAVFNDTSAAVDSLVVGVGSPVVGRGTLLQQGSHEQAAGDSLHAVSTGPKQVRPAVVALYPVVTFLC